MKVGLNQTNVCLSADFIAHLLTVMPVRLKTGASHMYVYMNKTYET